MADCFWTDFVGCVEDCAVSAGGFFASIDNGTNPYASSVFASFVKETVCAIDFEDPTVAGLTAPYIVRADIIVSANADLGAPTSPPAWFPAGLQGCLFPTKAGTLVSVSGLNVELTGAGGGGGGLDPPPDPPPGGGGGELDPPGGGLDPPGGGLDPPGGGSGGAYTLWFADLLDAAGIEHVGDYNFSATVEIVVDGDHFFGGFSTDNRGV